MKYHDPCNVSNNNCVSPAATGGSYGYFIYNYSNGGGAKFLCFSCGMPVCKKCSKIFDYYIFGKQRICDNCIIGYDLIKD